MIRPLSLAAALAATLTVSACSGHASSTSAAAPPASSSTASSAPAGTWSKSGVADVKAGQLRNADEYGATAAVTLTNTSGARASYLVTLAALTPSGTELDTAIALHRTFRPTRRLSSAQ